MIFFVSDTHFLHNNIIKYCNRPFESIKEHDEILIENWNAVVNKNDYVYHLGDVAIGSPDFINSKILSKLKGNIYLIKGNHDSTVVKSPCCERFQWIKDTHFLKTQHKGKRVEIWLSHYSHQVWPCKHYGSFHLFGHSHGNAKGIGLSFDVGVDNFNYYPISLDEVLFKIEQITIENTEENDIISYKEK